MATGSIKNSLVYLNGLRSLKNDSVKTKHKYDVGLSGFRISLEYYQEVLNASNILLATEYFIYSLDDANGIRVKSNIEYLTDIDGYVDIKDGSVGSELNHVICYLSDTYEKYMSEGELGEMLKAVRNQLTQVLIRAVKGSEMEIMIDDIIDWYFKEYQMFLATGSDRILTRMSEEIELDRRITLDFKPYSAVTGHPYKDLTIENLVSQRFNAYYSFITNNS